MARDMLRERTNAAGATLLSMTNGIVVFTALLPHLADVRKSSPQDQDMRNDVRLGEAAASSLVIGVGIVASGVSGSRAPAYVSIAVAGALVFMYESVLRTTGNIPVPMLSDEVGY